MTSIADEQAATEQGLLPRPNLPLLRKVLDHVDAHPEEWDQRMWAATEEYRVRWLGEPQGCGTAFCIAGHVALITGATPRFDKGFEAGATAVVELDDGSTAEVSAYAAAQLGLTLEEGDSWATGGLFRSSNTRADVQRIAERIATRVGEVL